MLSGYDDVLDVITKFRDRKIAFPEYKQRLLGRASLIGQELEYPKNWESKLDAWLELIEYFYGEGEFYELGCSLGRFLEDVIVNETRPMSLPADDIVVQAHFPNG
ncbi:hypothetical protein [Thalassobius sp. I31.1]|uniref:hypothetical protein n=1 Tax=Thalassobius sp. I31.1 TaxID=2109912 RepID=UPI000D1A7EF8|nr:hypothetical protein [Thalassobius sp. I31.1]